MYIIKDLTAKGGAKYHAYNTEDVKDIVVSITEDEVCGCEAQNIATNMHCKDEYHRPDFYYIACVE